MNILFVNPDYSDTFWTLKHALKFTPRKASFPPLGLLTVAALLPAEWNKKLTDINISPLNDEDIEWADYVFVTGLSVHKKSVRNIIEKCKKHNTKIVAGGPLFEVKNSLFENIDHIIQGEAEVTIPIFLGDLKKGKTKHIYKSNKFANMQKSPIPLWELINVQDYAIMCLQITRGCPLSCEFCDVPSLFGKQMRIKSVDQIIAELEYLYSIGWRAGILIVDDNLIGNRKIIKEEILPDLINWMKDKNYPFSFFTQLSIELADDEELMDMLLQAKFDSVFIGIESPNVESLKECKKVQNLNRDLIANIKKIQNFGFNVHAGFILGFDSDPPSIFENTIEFIQKSGIVTAMVGMLNALPKSRLYKRLEKENRILKKVPGQRSNSLINFIPKIKYETLLVGYVNVLKTIYSPENYNKRIFTFFSNYRQSKYKKYKFHYIPLMEFLKVIWFIGIKESGRIYFWKLFFITLFKYPQNFQLAMVFAAYGYHCRNFLNIES